MQSRSETHATETGEFEVGTIVHEGHEFAACGWYRDGDRITGYVAEVPNARPGEHRFALTKWNGEIMGYGGRTASWPVRSWIGDRMNQFEFKVRGVTYTGRGFGAGMLWRGKRKAKQ